MTRAPKPLPRHHIHRFSEHPDTGISLCACGVTPLAAETLDPDYVTACCGCGIEKKPTSTPITADSRSYCFACDRFDRPLVHHDQWQDAVCAACGRTWDEAGMPGSLTFHWRCRMSGSISAQSCGGECGRTVEAMRDADGVLQRIPQSARGRVKRGMRAGGQARRTTSDRHHAAA